MYSPPRLHSADIHLKHRSGLDSNSSTLVNAKTDVMLLQDCFFFIPVKYCGGQERLREVKGPVCTI